MQADGNVMSSASLMMVLELCVAFVTKEFRSVG